MESRRRRGTEESVQGNAVLTTDGAELAKLIAGVARSDRAAFRRLYDAAAPKLFAIILRILRNRTLAEDTLQDVFLRVWQNAGSFSVDAGPPMGWLTSIARNRSIDVLRQKVPVTVGSSTGDETDWFERIAEAGDREADMLNISALRHCLGELDETARKCVLLAYYEGFSREELAARYERPVNTIKTWLHRSLITLKSCLDTSA
jgi:RNA polymerase sigma factor (sigma-70 family)